MNNVAAQPDKGTLLTWLQTALELELATIPPYLVALLSIQLPSNREPAELIRSVMIEEMLHMALVANVMNAVGGHPSIDRQATPQYPLQMMFEGEQFADRQFPINLAAFSADVIETFRKIEEPQRLRPQAELMAHKIKVPALTIGEFYSRIVALLEQLDQSTADGIFTGDPANQISKDYYWSSGGDIVAVHDLVSAKEALDLVISQGEAAWSILADGRAASLGMPMKMGHYYRFSEIAYGRRYQDTDDPQRPPTGAVIAVDYSAVYPIKPNPRGRDFATGSKLASLNHSFNQRYTAMLVQLREALNGTPKTLYTAIMDSMHELTPIAHEMMKIPCGEDSNLVGCPSFEWTE
ncbi:hypothetical protein AC629_24270 [Bradyrhizobium sp. NAS80.1]|uniref:ferritin-like domain-containing protein n=1 Tax=Bradyrhizobium sp. NAS80.1 TaxID=1680159 RepID=UPI0009689ED8|nr:ferritin-like protein [Bradyrhizobium sp. NAS80.1]OKO82297.1 hypothetical protein AC629_24270 [Bradyrhizobium sp. NAS80.1]